MKRFEYKTFLCRAQWVDGEYRFQILMGKNAENGWVDADNLGTVGWEFVSFLPDGELNFEGAFPESQLRLIKAGIFKRESMAINM